MAEFERIGYRGVTYKAHTDVAGVVTASGKSAVIGLGVTLVADGKVGFGGATGSRLLGRICQYEDDGYVTVQDCGYCTMIGKATACPAAGDWVLVNNEGELIASKSGTDAVPTNAQAISVNATTKEVVARIS